MRSKAVSVGWILVAVCLVPRAALTEESAPDPRGRVVATVNGEALHAEDLESVLGELHRTPTLGQRSDFDVERLMFRLINDTLLAQEARTLELDRSDDIRRRVEARREQLARARLYRELIVDRFDLGEPALRELYADIERFARFRMISLPSRAELAALRPRAVAAPDAEAFGAIAKEVSKDNYSLRDGFVDAPLSDLYRSVIDYLVTAKPGQVSDPLPTPWGWSLLRLESLEAPDPEGFEARRGAMRRELRLRQTEELKKEVSRTLAERHEVEVDVAVLESIGVQRMHDGRLLPEFEGPERVVARAGGRAITVQQLAGVLASEWAGLTNPELAETWIPAALENLIFDELIELEALARGYGETPEALRDLHAFEARLLVTAYLREVVLAGLEVTPEEMREAYDENREMFRRPPKLHLLQITVATEPEARRVADLARGGADFAWLARQHSTDRFREAGGDRGWMPATSGVPLFKNELQTAAAGDVLGPKPFEDAWVVAKVDLLEDQGIYPFEEVSGNVRAMIEARKIERRIDASVQRLRERSEIWIDEEALDSLAIAPVAPEAAGATVPGHSG